ncbi:MAG TPA: hypothetical protein VN903_08445 [Polyangia bacterium]|jgi:hypothetical protein|nr:hypothetical protein [Polyangia bacterium]
MRGDWRRLLLAIGCGCATLVAGAAHAAPATAVLETTNAPGATDCPNAAALAAIVNDGIGRVAAVPAGAPALAASTRVAVSFERAAKSYSATVHINGANGGTRKLSNQGPGCGALANAVGLLLVVVLDADADTSAPSEAAVPASSAGAETSRAASREMTADVGVGGGVAEGLVGGWSPTVDLGGTLAYRRWAARLGGVWLPSKSSDFGPGHVDVGLAIARLALCLSTRDDRSRIALGLCAQQQIGWMRGRGLDYNGGNTDANQLWLATGAAIVAGGPLGRTLGWEIDVGAVLPLREQRFVVDNLGIAYRSEPVAFMTTLAITTRVW